MKGEPRGGDCYGSFSWEGGGGLYPGVTRYLCSLKPKGLHWRFKSPQEVDSAPPASDQDPTCFSEPLHSLLWLRECHLVYKKRFPAPSLLHSVIMSAQLPFRKAWRGAAAASPGPRRLSQLQRMGLALSLWARGPCRGTCSPSAVSLYFLFPDPTPCLCGLLSAQLTTSDLSSHARTLLSRGNNSPLRRDGATCALAPSPHPPPGITSCHSHAPASNSAHQLIGSFPPPSRPGLLLCPLCRWGTRDSRRSGKPPACRPAGAGSGSLPPACPVPPPRQHLSAATLRCDVFLSPSVTPGSV